MAQDLVTALDVAAPAELTLQFQDARRICEKLDEALAKEGYGRAAYSEAARLVLQLAWAVASHKQSTQVTVHHLAYALVCSAPEPGMALADCLKSDPGSFAAGCIIKFLSLGFSTGDADIVPPAVDAVRWMGEAAAIAHKRGAQNELLPEDLIRAVQDNAIPRTVRTHLSGAATSGKRRDIVLGSRSVPAPSTPGEIIEHVKEIEQGRSDPVHLANLVQLLEEIDERNRADAEDHKHALAAADKRLAHIEQRMRLVDHLMPKLETIDQRVVALDASRTGPPSGARMAAAVAAVLTLGVAAGLALTTMSQPESRLAQAVSAIAK